MADQPPPPPAAPLGPPPAGAPPPGAPPPPPPPPPLPVRSAPGQRRWLPVFLVVAVIALVLGGGYAAAVSVQPEGSGGPVDASGVEVAPVEGWSSETPPDGIALRLSKGGAFLDVFIVSFDGTEADLYRAYARDVLEPAASQLEVAEPEATTLDSGWAAAVGAYLGTFNGVETPIEGEVTAVLTSDGRGVIFDGWAAQGQLAQLLDEIQTMVDGAEVV